MIRRETQNHDSSAVARNSLSTFDDLFRDTETVSSIRRPDECAPQEDETGASYERNISGQLDWISFHDDENVSPRLRGYANCNSLDLRIRKEV